MPTKPLDWTTLSKPDDHRREDAASEELRLHLLTASGALFTLAPCSQQLSNRHKHRMLQTHKLTVMRASFTVLAILLTLPASAQQSAQPAVPAAAAAAALHIAEPAAVNVYGAKQIAYEQPLTAALHDGVWDVYGTLCCPDKQGHRKCEVSKCVGGVVHVSIRQSDGQVLSIVHTK
jgi:hypothetical protein